MPEPLAASVPSASPVPAALSLRIGSSTALAIVCGLVYYAAAELGLALRFPGLAVSALWPPNAVLLTALLLTSPRRWWIPLLAVVPAHFAAHADSGFPVWRLLWQIGLNATLTVGTASALRALIVARHPFGTLRDLSVYLVVAVFAVPAAVTVFAPNAVLSMIDATASAKEPAWLAWRSSYLSNAAAFLTLVPAMVLWVSEGPSWLRRATSARVAEAGLLTLGVYLACLFVLAGPAATPAAVYALLPLLLWAAARFGVGGVASVLFVMALSATVCAIEGRGPFRETIALESVFGLQLFLFAIALPVLILAVLMDERARSEAAIRDADDALRDSYAQVQDLAGRLISAQEGERTRIARDLHDDVGQQLAAVAIGLSRVRQHLPAESSETAEDVARLQEGVDQIAHALRDLSHELHPAALRHLGLGVALKGHCREFAERHGIEVDFRAEGDLRPVTPEIALCAFRVAQEALRNVAQHAGTIAVRVRLAGADGGLRLTIGDDGRGFDRDAIAALPGLGLVSMDERVRAVGGRLNIDTQPGEGTTVAIHVPIGDPAHGAPDRPPRG